MVLPKVELVAEVQFVDLLLRQIEMLLAKKLDIGLEVSIETARGMLNTGDIAFASPRIEMLVFGIADYGASLTMPSRGISGHGDAEESYLGQRWPFPMSRMAMAAKAAGLGAIDAPYGDFNDQAGLEKSCQMAVALGYDGKWAIHPAELDIMNRAFTPSAEDVSRSVRVLRACQEAKARGAGATALEGKLVDAASIRVARVTYEHAQRLGLIQENDQI
jgi:citrate lyase beta subunit